MSYNRWTTKEDNTLKSIYENGLKRDIMASLNKPWIVILRRARRLDLHRNEDVINQDRTNRGPRKDAWTPEEEKLLRDVYENHSKSEICSMFRRSWNSIWAHAYHMRLHRDPEILKQEMIEGGKKAPVRDDFWSKDEDNLLKKIYVNNKKDYIMSQLPNRTWKSIRERASKLGMKRRQKIISEEMLNNTKKTIQDRHGVDYSTQMESMKVKSRHTNMQKRGVEFPSQCPEVRKKIKLSVRKNYGVDNVFQSKEIQKKSEETMIQTYGVRNALQNKNIREKSITTLRQKYNVSNIFQKTDLIRAGMKEKYGVESPLQHPLLKEKVRQTNIARYGFSSPCQNPQIKARLKLTLQSPEVKEKKHRALKKRGHLPGSQAENEFYLYLKEIDPNTIHHKLHPIIKHTIDFYMPKFDLWVQYDGDYWHGKLSVDSLYQSKNIKKTMERDKFQNKYIPNLLRFSSKEIIEYIKENTIKEKIKERIEDKLKTTQPSCYQERKKIEWYEIDINNLPFNPENLLADQFKFFSESFSSEIYDFIEKYDKPTDNSFKNCFTARYENLLGGVIIIDDKDSPHILKKCNHKYVCTITRLTMVSWAPENLAEKLINYACQWMIKNTEKRFFIGNIDINNYKRIYKNSGFEFTDNSLYVMIWGNNKKERTLLHNLKNYDSQTYKIKNEPIIHHSTGITKSRKNPQKIQFIIDNYGKMSRKELAAHLKETIRWTKRQINSLFKKGLILQKEKRNLL